MTVCNCKKAVYCMLSVTLALCVVLFSTLVFSFTAAAESANTLTAISALNMRSSASTSASKVTTIPANATVTLLADSANGWAKVSYSSYTGYCSTRYLNAPAGSSVAMKGVTTSQVNMRSGKGTSYSVVTVVPNSTTVAVTSNADEDWAKASYSGKSGYISKDYLSVSFTISTQDSTTATEAPAPTVDSSTDVDYSGLPHWYSYSLTENFFDTDTKASHKVYLDKSAITLNINDTYKLVAFSTGDVPVLGSVSYSSSASGVASVSSSGVITAKSSGVATITATDNVSGNKATCVVTVTGKVNPTTTPTTPPTTPPTVAPTAAPTSAPTNVTETLSISESSATMYVGNQHLLKATSNAAVSWSSSNTSVATVSSGVVTAKSSGTAVIYANTSTKSVSCTITVKTATTTVSVSHTSANVTAGKTFLAYSSTSSVSWKSSDTKVATVNNGYILGVSKGKAIITVYKSGGAKTILVNVTDPAPVRFAYTSPNCATKNGTVTLIAITDSKRSAVKFDITNGSTTTTVNATSKTADGSNLIWKGTTSFGSSGTYNVTAYSKTGSNWATCNDAATTAFVVNSTDKTTTVCAQRRASDEIINLIANYEGFISSVYADPLTGDPTLGYGRVVYSGQQFYNNLTRTEAYAYLVQTVNNDGYASKVNSFLVDNKVKFNQQQFDALVCFVYNTGTGVLSNDDELKSALLDCNSGSSTAQTVYYINGSNVRIRKGPGTSYDIIKELSYGTIITIVEKTSTSWYKVKLNDGTVGYVATDYISSRTTSDSLDLNFVKKQNLINKFCQYHHANGCIYGLLYRRVDEMEVFFYNDYERNQGVYKYDINFQCANNPSFHT